MPGSKLLQLFNDIAKNATPRGIELATVVTTSPLRIRIDNMAINLEGDDLIVCAHLYPVTRYANISNKVTPDPPDQVTFNDSTYSQAGDNISAQYATVQLLDNVLNAGDKVAVVALLGEQQYLILDKVVTIS